MRRVILGEDAVTGRHGDLRQRTTVRSYQQQLD
jgi:hypothetical protein